jgi:hypothetical protein
LTEQDYLKARLDQERARAAKAVSPEVTAAHQGLAKLYEERLRLDMQYTRPSLTQSDSRNSQDRMKIAYD